MRDFNLDWVMARSYANARRVQLVANDSLFSVVCPAEPRRLSLIISPPDDFTASGTDYYMLYLKPDSNNVGPNGNNYGVFLWASTDITPYGNNGTITPVTDAGAVGTINEVDPAAVGGGPNTITGSMTFAATLTPAYTIVAGNNTSVTRYKSSGPLRLSLRLDGDLVRQQWWGTCYRGSGNLAQVLVAESLARPQDCKDWLDEANDPFPR